jgi:hypothetical protein
VKTLTKTFSQQCHFKEQAKILILIFQQHDKKRQRIYKTDLILWAFQKFTSRDPVLLNKTKIKFWALPFYIDRMLLGRTKELQVRQDIIIF